MTARKTAAKPAPKPTVALLSKQVAAQQEQINAMTVALNTVIWLHAEMMFGFKLAAAKRALAQAGPDIAEKLARGELNISQLRPGQ